MIKYENELLIHILEIESTLFPNYFVEKDCKAENLHSKFEFVPRTIMNANDPMSFVASL
jgi:hypothetical protein